MKLICCYVHVAVSILDGADSLFTFTKTNGKTCLTYVPPNSTLFDRVTEFVVLVGGFDEDTSGVESRWKLPCTLMQTVFEQTINNFSVDNVVTHSAKHILNHSPDSVAQRGDETQAPNGVKDIGRQHAIRWKAEEERKQWSGTNYVQ
ncbi:unnamed protein product [Sphenostylis stenocarpa]|uniref:Uncharacterized protein n=1 Tax=Sphenostylis stenocarpa TaxID=92480 RepID=A0AA86VMM1_9FABA|nr:unnamed protein product [Sphenostylis stenocarpa]